MLIVIGVVGLQAPSMLALASLREISPEKAGRGCHGYVPTADVDGTQERAVNHYTGILSCSRSQYYMFF